MYKETLRAIAGIGLFPAVSLVLFFIVFSVMLLRVFCMNRADTDHLAGLPLEPADGLPPARQEGCR
jgi:hypothetical protein